MQFRRQFLRRFLGHVVAAVQATSLELCCPWSPDPKHIAVKSFEIVPQRPKRQRRALDLASRAPIRFVMLPVDS